MNNDRIAPTFSYLFTIMYLYLNSRTALRVSVLCRNRTGNGHLGTFHCFHKFEKWNILQWALFWSNSHKLICMFNSNKPWYTRHSCLAQVNTAGYWVFQLLQIYEFGTVSLQSVILAMSVHTLFTSSGSVCCQNVKKCAHICTCNIPCRNRLLSLYMSHLYMYAYRYQFQK